MPTYYYRARGADGTPRDGTVTVGSEVELLRRLEQESLTPIHVEIRRSAAQSAAPGFQVALDAFVKRWQTHTNPKNVMLFSRQLATMQSAGLPLVRSIKSIARDIHDRKFQKMLTKVAGDVEGGRPLSEALSEFPGSFDEVYTRLVYSGEVSGTLDSVLRQLAVYLEKAESLRTKVRSALLYPIFVVCTLIVALGILFVFVVPTFSNVYRQANIPLPTPTLVLLAASDFIVRNLPWVILGLLLLVIAGIVFGLSRQGRLFFDTLKLKVPVFGWLLRLHIASRFTRTLGILSRSGVQILTALKVVAPVPANARVEKAILEVKGRVEQGHSLSSSLEEVKLFPDLVVQMVATGEESGKLDEMLTLTSDYYEEQVAAAVEGMAGLIEPILIVSLGAVIGTVLLCLYLPIFNLGHAFMRAAGG